MEDIREKHVEEEDIFSSSSHETSYLPFSLELISRKMIVWESKYLKVLLRLERGKWDKGRALKCCKNMKIFSLEFLNIFLRILEEFKKFLQLN